MALERQGQHEARNVVAANLRLLKAYVDKTDEEIANEMGFNRSWVQERMSGVRECKVSDLAAFALYFGIPAGRLFVVYAPRDSNPEPSDSRLALKVA